MTTENQENTLPKNTWRILGLVAVLLLVITVTGIGFISAGFFDPKPVGTLTAEYPLQPEFIPTGTQQLNWLDDDLTASNFTLRLTAAYQSGEKDVGYGVAVGSDTAVFVVAISPLGNAAITHLQLPPSQPVVDEGIGPDDLDNMIANGPSRNEAEQFLTWPISATAQSETPLLQWQPWPHINGGQDTNEIWLDKRGDEITVRINRELLWMRSFPISVSKIGLWAGSYNEAGTIDFKTLTIFSE